MSGSSAPEAARAAAIGAAERQVRYVKAIRWTDVAGNWDVEFAADRCMALADAEVAAASVELRQEVDRLSAECEALRGTVAEGCGGVSWGGVVSAVEALAEVLRKGLFELDDMVGHEVMAQCLADWLATAIRSMPAEQVAELIDGEVSNCWKVEYDDGSAATFWEETEAREYADECRVYAGDTTVYPAARAVTPWLPLGVSPETNGEQK